MLQRLQQSRFPPVSFVLGLVDLIYVVARSAFAALLAMRLLFSTIAAVGGAAHPKTAKTKPQTTRPLFFHDGLGDVDRVFELADSFDHSFSDGVHGASPALYRGILQRAQAHRSFALKTYARLNPKLRASMAARAGTDAFDVFELDFDSPLADLLVDPAADGAGAPNSKESVARKSLRTAHMLVVWPRAAQLPACFTLNADAADQSAGKKSSPCPGMSVLLPATGEQKPSERLLIAAALIRTNGLGSVIVSAPLYWHRRPIGQRMHNILNVGDMMMQGMAISTEAATVTNAFLRATTGQRTPVVFSGFSWGGAMTVVSAMALAKIAEGGEAGRFDLRRVAAVPYVGCGSPGVLCEGILCGDVDWAAMCVSFDRALAGEGPWNNKASSAATIYRQVAAEHPGWNQLATVKEATRRVLRRLDTAQISRNAAPAVRGKIGALHSIVTSHDHFVPNPMGDELHRDALAFVADPVSKDVNNVTLERIGGGHVAAFFSKEPRLVAAISAATDTIAAMH